MKTLEDFLRANLEDGKIEFNGREYSFNRMAAVFYHQALEYLKSNRHDEALKCLNKSIEDAPTIPVFLVTRGIANEGMANLIEAERDYRKALEIDKEDFHASYRLGMLLHKMRQPIEAFKWLEISFQNSADYDLETIGFGRNSALGVSKKVIANNYGNLLGLAGKTDEGLKYLNIAIALDENYSVPHLTKGVLLLRSGKFEDGLKSLIRASELGNKDAEKLLDTMESEPKNTTVVDVKDTPQILELGKKFAETEPGASENGGKRLSQLFMKDLRHIILKHAEHKNLVFSDLINIMVDYNLDMWQEYERMNASDFNEVTKAMVSHEVTLAVKGLNIVRFDFDEIYLKIFNETNLKFISR